VDEKEITLLTNGGILGICDDAPVYKGNEINLSVIGVLMENDIKLNAKDIRSNIVISKKELQKKLIFVCGTSGETGKTTVTKNLINNIKELGNYKVGGVKLSGTGCMEDILC
jgi:Mrp family chromosome partitioning ATPase